MATLNVCSMSFGTGEFRNPPDGVRRLAARMRELGIKPELEVYDTGHLDVALALRHEGLLADPLQFSIVLGVRGGAAATPENLISMVRRLPEDAVWQVIGDRARQPRHDRDRPGHGWQRPHRNGGHPAAPARRTGAREPTAGGASRGGRSLD